MVHVSTSGSSSLTCRSPRLISHDSDVPCYDSIEFQSNFNSPEGKYRLIIQLFLFSVFLVLTKTCYAYFYGADYYLPDATDLTSQLLQGYNKRVLGTYNLKEGTTIYLKVFMTSLTEFDDINAKISFVAFSCLTGRIFVWVGIVQQTTYPLCPFYSQMFGYRSWYWQNRAKNSRCMGYNWMKIIYTSDGYAFWNPGHLFHASCVPDITNYPFDTHVSYRFVILDVCRHMYQYHLYLKKTVVFIVNAFTTLYF